MDVSRMRRELGADLANAIAQRDHQVEGLRDELVEVLAPIAAEVDASLADHAHGVGMQRLGVAPGADCLDRPRRELLEQGLRDLGRVLLPVHKNSTRGR